VGTLLEELCSRFGPTLLAALGSWFGPRRSFLADISNLTRALGMAPDPQHPLQVRGVVEGREVVLRYKWASVELCTAPGPDLGFALGPAQAAGTWPTGDGVFDRRVAARGADPLAILATLDASTRDALVELVPRGVVFDGTRFRWVLHEGEEAEPSAVAAQVRELARVHERMVANAAQPVIDGALERALHDRSAQLRLTVVEALDGRGYLHRPEVSTRLAQADPPVRLEAARRTRDVQALRALLDEDGLAVRARAALALIDAGASGSVEAKRLEEALTQVLADEDLGADGARGLVKVGRTGALQALRRAADEAPGGLRRSLLEAADALAARLQAEGGSLALVDPREGALALADPDGKDRVRS
jgi:hypothetical protein